MSPAPIVTLTTDFGQRDPFAGIMKGVILGVCPSARLVDLSHDIAPQDVGEAALALESAWRFFPAGSIHVAVVDPGVGSARRGLALRSGGHYFVGPDNGLFTFALEGEFAAVSIETAAYRRPDVSRTFHGRDVFAPAAGYLASGLPLERLGPTVGDPVRIEMPRSRREGDDVVGEVIGGDRFGNLQTSVSSTDVAELAAEGPVSVEVGGRALGALVGCYAEGPQGRPAALLGSTGRLEIFVRNGDARRLLGESRGVPVRVRRARRETA